MTPKLSPPSKSAPFWKATVAPVMESISGTPSHPLHIALRTYSLCLSLCIGPELLQTISVLVTRPKNFTTRARAFWRALLNELRPTKFPFAMTIAAGGGAALQQLWNSLEGQHAHDRPRLCCITSKLSLYRRAFLANVVSSTLALTLLRWNRRRRPGARSPTLDLSLLILARMLDASMQLLLLRKAREIAARRTKAVDAVFRSVDTELIDKQSQDLANEWKNKAAMHLDALLFWASSARIMWCFFYQPHRLPLTFVKWIHSLANVDMRLLEVLRALREGAWSYTHGSPTKSDIVRSLAEELGRSPSWADPVALPACGGTSADEIWKQLGVSGRSGVGGMPCELVHGGIGASLGLQNDCIANATIRALYAFAQALVLHLPVQFLPILFTKPSSILRPHRALSALLSSMRSAAFLSAFVSSCWLTVCFTRTLALARLFPTISHDIWDGPCGSTLASSLVCGMSIWIENARRRREVALYVLPRALRASIPEDWLRSRHPVVQYAECLTFVLSLASLLTFSLHQPDSLRGLSRWALTFAMKGPNTGFHKRGEGEIATSLLTPADSSLPPPIDSRHKSH